MEGRQLCREIAQDMERDVFELEGQPFTGRNVAETFGKQAAAIAALAKLLERMLPEELARAKPPGVRVHRHGRPLFDADHMGAIFLDSECCTSRFDDCPITERGTYVKDQEQP